MIGVAVGTTRTRLGPDAVLTSYAALLLVVPSVYTVGSFAVTAAMIVGLAATALWFGGLLLPESNVVLGVDSARRGVLVYFGVVIVSYLVSMRGPLDSATESSADRRLLAVLSVVGVALLAVDGLRDRAAVYRLLAVLVAAGGAVAVIGIVQYFAGFDLAARLRPPGFADEGSGGFIFRRAEFDRVAGTARHPIEFGIVCSLLLPIALHMAARSARPAGRRASLLVAVLLGLALPMAVSRSAVLATAAALAIMLPGLAPGRRWRLLTGISIVAWGVTLLAPGIVSLVRQLFFADAASGSNRARRSAYEVAIDLYAQRPWLGHGLGTSHGTILDNQLLVTLVESGLVGVVGLAALANGTVLAVRRARRNTEDDGLRELALVLVASLAAAVVGSAGLGILVYPTTSGLIFLTIGVAGAVQRITAADAVLRQLPGAARDLMPVRR